MADVKWIKITTDLFDNKKIKKIRRMPEGNNIIVIWVYLLVKAGECNNLGGLFLTSTIPYTLQDISEDAEFSLDIVRFAIATLEKFNMIEIYEDVLYIKNWAEYQNIEGLDKIREQTRLRVEKFRDRQKSIECNVTCNAGVTQGNATEEELELDKNKNIKRGFRPPSIEDVKSYCLERNNSIDAENFIDFYTSKNWMVGKTKMVDWKASIRTWERRENKTTKKSNNPFLDKLKEEEELEQKRSDATNGLPEGDLPKLL